MGRKWLIGGVISGCVLVAFYRLRESYRGAHQQADYVQLIGEEQPEELVVLVNGLFGNSKSGPTEITNYLAEVPRLAGRNILLIKCGVSDSIFQQNIYSAGVRPSAHLLCSKVAKTLKRHPSITSLHMIGTSFGGLVCRAAVPKIVDCHPHLTLGAFVTFCTPHCGILQERRHWSLFKKLYVHALGFLWDWVADLTLSNKTLETLRDESHVAALAAFRSRVCVASVHDTTVSCLNAGMQVPIEVAVPKPKHVYTRQRSTVLSQRDITALGLSFHRIIVTGEHNGFSKAYRSQDVLASALSVL